MTKLTILDHTVSISKGELVSYQVAGHEFIHQKGSPGWGNSDTEMFPVIGPTAGAGFRVQVPKGNAIQDQHGLLRELEYQKMEENSHRAVYVKNYVAGTPVKNSKFPEASTARWLLWPYDFEFRKAYELSEKGLEIKFTISGQKDMPYMLGYHPAFKLYSDYPLVVTDRRSITLTDVLKAGSRALQVEDCSSVVLKDLKAIKISTEGFGNFMLWTEVPNMICIEPITFYPYSVPQDQLHEGFQYLAGEPVHFKVKLAPMD